MTSIYNTTDGPLAIDRAGRMLAAGERRDDVEDVDGSPLAGHISASRIVVVDDTPAEEVAESDTDGDPQPEQQTSTRTRKGRASTQES